MYNEYLSARQTIMNVTIIGGGYVGLVTGTCLSTLNHNVTIIEIFPEKVEAINNARQSTRKV
jgi:UDPglucose 6-dehydrogenase